MSNDSTTQATSDDELAVFAALADIEAPNVSPRAADQLRRIADELIEAKRYTHSCPDHVSSTCKTAAFRLRELAEGRLPSG